MEENLFNPEFKFEIDDDQNCTKPAWDMSSNTIQSNPTFKNIKYRCNERMSQEITIQDQC